MVDKDNRIRLDQTPVDFNESGITGQQHDEYPADSSRIRFDLMRTYLIGLLSNQSSEGDEPLEKREGTLWFNKTNNLLKLYTLVEETYIAKHLANFIGIDVDGEETSIQTLQDVLTGILSSMNNVGPRVIWSGFFTHDEINQIPIPDEFQGYAVMDNMHPLVYVEGALLDPRKTSIETGAPAYIKVTGLDVIPSQEYTVILEIITDIKQVTVPAEG